MVIHRRGFTAIELVAVTAAALVLMLVLVLMLSRSSQQGRSADCMAQLKLIGTAVQLYVADADDRLPPIATGMLPRVQLFTDLLQVYVGGRDVWLCPDGDMRPKSINSANGRLLHYGMNAYGYGNVEDALKFYAPSLGGLCVSDLMEPEAVIAVADASPDETPEDIGNPERRTYRWPLTSLAVRRHNGGFNALYVGGAIRWRRDAADHRDWTCRLRESSVLPAAQRQ